MQHRDPSSQDSSAIQPAEFRFPSDERPQMAQTSPRAGSKTPHPQFPVAITGALLLSGLVGVFWFLPRIVEKPTPRSPVPTTAEQPAASAEHIKASPYSEAEIAQQRRQVQQVLQEILILQEELQERQVEVWAEDAFVAARTLAEQADGIYRKRRFMEALEKYRESLTAFQQLRDSIPERIEKHLAEGHHALDHGNAEAAHKAFDLVLTISRQHPRGVKGKERAEKLPQVWQHYTAGQKAFAENRLDQAREQLQKALAIDPQTRPASELLPRVESAITERDYSEAMSTGYAAIASEDFASAEAAFLRAQTLKPSATEPSIGLQQARNGAEQKQIEQLFARARTQEAEEDWHAALDSYAALLKKDASLVDAITGKARAQARAQLDDQLRELLADPLSLSGSKRNQYARQVLADARRVNNGIASSRLQKQVETLENAITQALIPRPVRLQSDSNTNVAIYHVGKLGNFDEREIALKPGRYIAVGTREGYRDVRREFTVVPGEEIPTVIIQCAEKIVGANNS
ncbi:tetratricopeptide repeat protein [Microbulbifer thermotolerans]|uniref:tetratricopeptide repeat protein n=1 Tax=Microbulbifer thermotolerans TaxID=252514 RepID=UPI0022497F43|nr:hypothetical protein [Microbulbifer thermotolerans]MCX2832420.1 hypothetical protein [Microbulbifer thermotolerans]